MKKMNFLQTSDEQTAQLLSHQGYELFSIQGGVWTYLNNAKLTFDNKDAGNKVIYSNTLFI